MRSPYVARLRLPARPPRARAAPGHARSRQSPGSSQRETSHHRERRDAGELARGPLQSNGAESRRAPPPWQPTRAAPSALRPPARARAGRCAAQPVSKRPSCARAAALLRWRCQRARGPQRAVLTAEHTSRFSALAAPACGSCCAANIGTTTRICRHRPHSQRLHGQRAPGLDHVLRSNAPRPARTRRSARPVAHSASVAAGR